MNNEERGKRRKEKMVDPYKKPNFKDSPCINIETYPPSRQELIEIIDLYGPPDPWMYNFREIMKLLYTFPDKQIIEYFLNMVFSLENSFEGQALDDYKDQMATLSYWFWQIRHKSYFNEKWLYRLYKLILTPPIWDTPVHYLIERFARYSNWDDNPINFYMGKNFFDNLPKDFVDSLKDLLRYDDYPLERASQKPFTNYFDFLKWKIKFKGAYSDENQIDLNKLQKDLDYLNINGLETKTANEHAVSWLEKEIENAIMIRDLPDIEVFADREYSYCELMMNANIYIMEKALEIQEISGNYKPISFLSGNLNCFPKDPNFFFTNDCVGCWGYMGYFLSKAGILK